MFVLRGNHIGSARVRGASESDRLSSKPSRFRAIPHPSRFARHLPPRGGRGSRPFSLRFRNRAKLGSKRFASPGPPMPKSSLLQPLAVGLVAAFVGWASSFAVILKGLTAVGASDVQAASGLMALSIAMGVAGIALSVRSRMPISGGVVDAGRRAARRDGSGGGRLRGGGRRIHRRRRAGRRRRASSARSAAWWRRSLRRSPTPCSPACCSGCVSRRSRG